MSCKITRGATKSAPRCARAALVTEAQQSDAQEAIPGLPDHLVVTHVLGSEVLRDPLLLARLRAVSHAMRSAVAETGREVRDPGSDIQAVELGCLSTLKHRQSRGRLSHQEYLCQAAARSGQLEELKVLRENGWPWDKDTCWRAATGGHLEALQWLRANGCPWDEQTCYMAARGGHLEMLQWARANGCPWDHHTLGNARRLGHLELVNWAIANGCPE